MSSGGVGGVRGVPGGGAVAQGTWSRSSRTPKVITIVAGVVIALGVIGLVNKKVEPIDGSADGGSTMETLSPAASSEPSGFEPPAPAQPSPALAAYPVHAVVDGDTLHVDLDGQDKTVRVIGIDAPETSECWGDDATSAATALLAGASVQLVADPTQADTDQYDRLLRYVQLPDGTDLGSKMISDGNAYEYTYDVPYQKQASYQNFQSAAAANGNGAWGATTCDGQRTPPIMPSSAMTTAVQPIEPATPTAASGNCDIKGNISRNGEKIYHEPGDRDYDKTEIEESEGERWFCSTADALAAGWRAPKN